MECLLYTPGLDSFILDKYLTEKGHKFDRLYFDIKSNYSEIEMKILKYNETDIEIVNDIKLGQLEQSDAYIPNRNFLLAMMANSMSYDKIWIGGSKSDRVNDNNKNVFKKLSKLLTVANKRIITVDSPFWDVYKSDMITWLLEHNQPMSELDLGQILLSKTFSCYYPVESNKTKNFIYYGSEIYQYDTQECLNCPACFRKNVIMNKINLLLPFYNKDIIDRYANEFKNCLVETPRSVSTRNYISELALRGDRLNG